MFNEEFFPTPESVIELMGIDCYGKVVVEPSAGSGNIVNWLLQNGAREVLACEKHPTLRKTLSGTCQLIAEDFFTVKPEQISHAELIVMNPPFSNGADHILHAWKIAPEGCEVIALCNWETINKNHWGVRRELAAVVEGYGEAINLGPVFQDAERRTDIGIGLVRLFKPVISEGMDMDGFYLTGDEERQDNGIIGFNEIRAVVNSYLAAVRCFGKVEEVAKELKAYTNVKIIGADDKVHELTWGDGIAFKPTYSGDGITTKEAFAKGYQKRCWQYIFNRVGIEKYVTSGVLKDVNKFIESRVNYPFTVRNIGRMLDIIFGTRAETMQRAIVEAVDNFTRYTDENRYGVEGWKTNAGHLLNKKFITPWIAEISMGGRGLGIRTYQGNWEQIVDLTKALCFVTGRSYDSLGDVKDAPVAKWEDGKPLSTSNYGIPTNHNVFSPNTWYEWGFFRFKIFKKGTGHFTFKSEDEWAMLNQAYAKVKGQVLPENIKTKTAA
jgi:hypothetical protein